MNRRNKSALEIRRDVGRNGNRGEPFLLVLLALMIVRRQWRAAAWAIGACIVMLTSGGLAFGWNNLEDWIRILRTPPAAGPFSIY